MPTKNAGKVLAQEGLSLSPGVAGAAPRSAAMTGTSRDLRKHLRFKIEEAVTGLQVRGHLMVLGMGRANVARATVNLSEGGALILAGESLSVGTKVHFKIEVERYNEVIDSEGEVRWCFESAREPKRYYVGVGFTKMDPLQEKKIGQMREWFSSPDFKARKAPGKPSSSPDIELLHGSGD